MKYRAMMLAGGLGLSFMLSACGAEVTVSSPEGSTTGGAAGKVDQRCYLECIDRGGTRSECADECWVGEDGTDDGWSSGGSPSGTSGGEAQSSAAGGATDGMAERNCYECLKKNAHLCAEQYEACEESLACTMLSKCPYECLGDPDCIADCNNIIPKGVQTLSKLVGCMICGGGPCEIDCVGSVLNEYCGGG